MFGNRLIKSNNAGAACTTDTVQILDGTPLESIATYQLDGAATSIPNNTYPGTFTNPAYAAGEFGQAAEFNGSSSVIRDIPNSISTSLKSNNAFTYSFWIKFNSLGSQSIIQFFNDVTSSVSFNGTNFYAYIYNSSAQQKAVTNSATVTTGVWYNVVFKGDSNGIFLYVNNNTPASTSWGGDWFIYTNATYKYNAIGARQNSGGFTGYVDGLIDQVRIFNTALTSDQVTDLYNETVATASNSYISIPSCIAYYKMSDATDQTGSYDGTPTNVNFNVAGKFGNAGEFNGSSSKVSFASPIQTTNTDFSISLWFNLSAAFSSGNQTILGSDSNVAPPALIRLSYVSANSYRIIVERSYGSGIRYSSSSGYSASTINPNTWYHLTVTYDASDSNRAIIYLDTTLQNNKNLTSLANETVTTSQALGQYRNNAIQGFNGSIDQVRIFNRAITATEVETLYNEVECIPTIVPTDYFNTVLYTGNGGTQSITSLDFQPDLVWLKSRETTRNHILSTSVQQQYNYLSTNLTNAEATSSARITSLDSNGFTVGSSANVNENNTDYVAWAWKAADTTTTIAANTVGNTIASDVRANTDAGFSIVSYTGNGVSGATVGHGLAVEPNIVIVKARSGISGNWIVYDSVNGATNYMLLNGTQASGADSTPWNNTSPTNTTFSLGTSSNTNSANPFIAYCFHSVEGYSKIGSYTGTGASGNSIVTGFEPAFLLVKRTDSGDNWLVFDNKRNTTNPTNLSLVPNSSAAESVGNLGNGFSFLSNGFEVVSTDSGVNANGGSYIFMAFAADPAPEPVLANSFNTVLYTGNGGTQSITGVGFDPNMVWVKRRDASANNHILQDTIRGGGQSNTLIPDRTDAQGVNGQYGYISSFGTDSFGVAAGTTSAEHTNFLNASYVAWAWKAAELPAINNNGSITSVVSANPAAGFSIVSYKGNNVAGATIGHGLGAAPDMIILKNRNTTDNWTVQTSDLTYTDYIDLNNTNAATTNSSVWYAAPTSTVFSFGANPRGNGSGNDIIAYCFNSVDGYQKVGSYTGNTSGVTVTTGFSPRWIIIKNATAAGDHWGITDAVRNPSGQTTKALFANLSISESDNIAWGVTFTLNGFEVPSTSTASTTYNENGQTFIYLAIA